MNITDKIDQDLKAALLAGEKDKATVLRGVKSAILNEEIAKGVREKGLDEPELIALLKKEAKKRQESADLYQDAGETARANQELSEKEIINQYLPAEMSDDEVQKLVEDAIQEIGEVTPQTMGKIIGLVKQRSGGAADGAKVAALVKERM